jgi:anti-sigma B factor antagonist
MDYHIEQRQNESAIIFDKNKIIGTEAAGIQNAVLDLLEKENKTIVVDLSKVDYISSYGIGMLLYAHTTCTKRGFNFYVDGVNKKIAEILKMVHLDKIVEIKYIN